MKAGVKYFADRQYFSPPVEVISAKLIRLETVPSMIRLITAPAVGLLLGAIEGGVVFAILTAIDIRRHPPVIFGGTDGIYLGAIIGTIFGSVCGAAIGLAVALLNAGGRRGLLLGSAMGLMMAMYLFITSSYHDEMFRVLSLIVTPAGASIGVVSAVLTSRRKQAQPSPEPRRSHRIIS